MPTRDQMGEATDGRRCVVIEPVSPEIDCGPFPIKRVVGESVIVEANVFGDSHDQVICHIVYWHNQAEPRTSPMQPVGNDRWRGEFTVENLGTYRCPAEGWIDRFQTWRRDPEKRVGAGQDVSVDLLIGVALIEGAATRAKGEDAMGTCQSKSCGHPSANGARLSCDDSVAHR